MNHLLLEPVQAALQAGTDCAERQGLFRTDLVVGQIVEIAETKNRLSPICHSRQTIVLSIGRCVPIGRLLIGRSGLV